ncbi:MAG: carbohydrate binding family 9 domain-containing protein [Gemmatimonadetes bacterium]|nr:carbohydrate binding family 9 domain-containing protein [Gemmatimonadota bacterium]
MTILLDLAATTLLLAGADSVYHGRQQRLTVALPRIEAAISIDGVLDEPAWARAALLTGFSQYRPVDGLPADDSTEVLVWYSAEALYLGIRAFEPHRDVRATLAERDKLSDGDYVEILLDTFNDRRRALVFAVNPLGTQADGIGADGRQGGWDIGNIDLTQDFVFTSHGRLTPSGYEVEIAIPYKSIRFQQADVQDWGINVLRYVQHSGHQQTWTPARQSGASFLNQSGTLSALQIVRPVVLDLNPVATARLDGAPAADGWRYDDPHPEVGGNLRWGITTNWTLSGTANPDFSQVEADVQQLLFDPRQALYFSEKRPFFAEGSEQFDVPNRLVYTRRIQSPAGAIKLNGKFSGTSLGLLSAIDSRSASVTGADRPLVNVVRVRRDLGSQSTTGLLYTDRVDGKDYNRVVGTDARLVFARLNAMSLQVARSMTSAGGSRTQGTLWAASYDRTGRRVGLSASAEGFHRDFQAAAGFIGRTDVVNAGFAPRIAFFGAPGALLENWTVSVPLSGRWRYGEFFDGKGPADPQAHIHSDWSIRGGWRLTWHSHLESYRYDPELYRGYAVERIRPTGTDTVSFDGTHRIQVLTFLANVATPRVSGFSGNLSVTTGRDVNFHEWAPAFVVFLTATADWRPTERLRIEARYPLQYYRRLTDGTTVARRQVPRLKLEYQLARALFVRVVGQYDAGFRDALTDDSRSGGRLLARDATGVHVAQPERIANDVRLDWLLSYEPTPGTVLFAGYGASLSETDAFAFRGLRRSRDGLFVKVSYLFRQ